MGGNRTATEAGGCRACDRRGIWYRELVGQLWVLKVARDTVLEAVAASWMDLVALEGG